MGLTDALTAPLNSVEQVADTTENSLYDSVHKKTDPYKADECVYRNGKDFHPFWFLFIINILYLWHHVSTMMAFARPENQQRVF